MPKKKKVNFIRGLGRRKTSIARVRLFKGGNESLVNGQLIGEYFPGPVMSKFWQGPFKETDTLGKCYVTVKVSGGGKESQLRAVIHGMARALAATKANFRSPLKKAGLLTRDARSRERRKVGQGGRARKKKQSPKR